MKHIKQLKIDSKKLQSGMCQVTFKARLNHDKTRQGYLLTPPTRTIREVVHDIVGLINERHSHLFAVGKQKQVQGVLMH